MVNRMTELKEKLDPGSTKKEKDAKKAGHWTHRTHIDTWCRPSAPSAPSAPKDSKKKTPLSAEEQKDFAKLQGEIEIYKVQKDSANAEQMQCKCSATCSASATIKAKLRTEFGYSNKEMKADPDLKDSNLRGWEDILIGLRAGML